MLGGEFEIDLSTQRDTFQPASDICLYCFGRVVDILSCKTIYLSWKNIQCNVKIVDGNLEYK